MRLIANAILYATLLAGGTYLAFRPTFDSGFARMQTDVGDTVLNHYILEHSWQAVTNPDYRGTLLSPPFYYPQPLVLSYSENLLGAAPIYWALRAVIPYDLAYQWWMILCSALNFVAFAAAARWLGLPASAAALGGFLWAFGLVHMDQLRHQQMIPRFWCPLAVYHAWGLAARPNVRSLNRLAAAVTLQAFTCIYTGWFLVLGLAVFVPAVLWLRHAGGEFRRWVEADRRRIGFVLGGWGAALGLFFLPYFLANKGMSRGYAECVPYLPNCSTWICGPPDSWWYQTIGPYRDSVAGECAMFCGPTLLGIFFAAAWWAWIVRPPFRHSPQWTLMAASVITAGVLVAATMGFWESVSAWWLVRLLPGGGAIRVVARVYVPVYLFANLAVIVALSVWLAESRAWWRKAVLYLIMAVIVFEQTGHQTDSFDKGDFYARADACAASLKGAEVGYLTRDFGGREDMQTGLRSVQMNLLGMWAGLRANVPVTNGYSGRSPDGYRDHVALQPDEVQAWLAPRYSGRLRFVDAQNQQLTWEVQVGEPTKRR